MSEANTLNAAASARFIDPRVLARVNNLELVARTVVEGFISGMHRSPMLGLSIDFAEHRAYMPGDDIRRIDWRVFARTDRLYVKEFEADTNANFSVVLDISKSMDFGSKLSKLDYARFLAASLVYLSNRQRDRVGLLTFASDIVEVIPPSAKHFDTILHALDRLTPLRGALADGQPLRKIAGQLRRRGVLAVISDFYADPEAIVPALAELRMGGHDVIAFHVLDPVEVDFNFSHTRDEAGVFEDMETGEQLPIAPTELRDRYRTLVQGHIDTLRRRLSDNRIDYVFVDTSQPLDQTLFHYLSDRARLSRVR